MSKLKTAVNKLLKDRPEWAHTLILAGLRGSDAHGTKLPANHPKATDDIDTFGVSVQSIDWYLSLDSMGKSRQSWDTAGKHYDHLIHDVRKMFRLLEKGNPNVHCWLWAEPEDRKVLHPAGQMILDNRKMFLSQRCFSALAGYARSQIERMERKKYAGYQGEKRKKLVDEHGYDVKHAAHCVRLLNMGIELAQTGVMHTRRPIDERFIMLEIKAGRWAFKDVKELTSDLFDRFKACDESVLPKDVNRELINELLVEVIKTTND